MTDREKKYKEADRLKDLRVTAEWTKGKMNRQQDRQTEKAQSEGWMDRQMIG